MGGGEPIEQCNKTPQDYKNEFETWAVEHKLCLIYKNVRRTAYKSLEDSTKDDPRQQVPHVSLTDDGEGIFVAFAGPKDLIELSYTESGRFLKYWIMKDIEDHGHFEEMIDVAGFDREFKQMLNIFINN